jgi:sporulation protein YlmC with PRC-barrel domain
MLQDPKAWSGVKVKDADGERIGTVQDVFVDRRTGEPAWVAVKTGFFGHTGLAGLDASFVPIDGARVIDEHHVQLPVRKAQVRDAPALHAGRALSASDERRLYAHYGRSDYDPSEAEGGRLRRFDASTTVPG